MRRKTAHRICQYCEKDFLALQNEVERGKAKYCSISCGVAFRNKSITLTPQQVFFKNMSKENHPNGCWIYKVGKRYGKMKIGDKCISAHRFSYEFHKGKIEEKMVICHTCDNKLCVNPNHLFIGTQKDNIQDMLSKDRANRPKGSRHHWSQLNEKQVLEIKERLYKYEGVTQLAKEFGVSHCVVEQIRIRKSWKHIKTKEELEYENRN